MRLDILAFSLIPAGGLAAGGLIALWRRPGPRLKAAIQHFTAGVLFAALATELLPDLVHRELPWVTLGGFALGVAAMLAVKLLSQKWEERGARKGGGSTSLVATVGVDVLLDGILVGLGFAAGASQGLLLTLALALEVFFLGLSAAASMRSSGTTSRRIFLTTLSFSVLIVTGAAAGSAVLAHAGPLTIDAMLAFGLAALLYLVTEELLVEAHETPETPIQASMFFVGFIALFVIEMLAARN